MRAQAQLPVKMLKSPDCVGTCVLVFVEIWKTIETGKKGQQVEVWEQL